MQRLLLTLALLCALPGPALAGMIEADAAFRSGDYRTALREYRLAAAAGSIDAQYSLGAMHDNGQGMAQDYDLAVLWYRLAADRGHAGAQFALGGINHVGQGVPQDYVRSYMWYHLAARQGHPDALQYRNLIAALMTPVELAEARKLAREWRAR